MSTDTDEECAAEGRAGTETGIGNTETLSSTALVPSTSLLLITANVGSVFEDAEALAPKWRHEVTKFISEQNPQFVAIHFQEVRICFACGSPSTDPTCYCSHRLYHILSVCVCHSCLRGDCHSELKFSNFSTEDSLHLSKKQYLEHSCS